MDREKFLELMKNLQGIMKCPYCGALYNLDEIQFVGNKDGYMLLSMTCSKCSLPVWVNFFAGNSGAPRPPFDLSVADFNLTVRPEISADEVITFHRFLKTFDGNFQKHLKTR
jgi:hypothetical protein